MAVKHKTKALVFGKIDTNEADRNFYIFTPDFGKLKIFAKAIRKIDSKLKGGIDIFSLSEIEFIQGKNKKTLTDAVLKNSFYNIASDINKFKVTEKIVKIMDLFIKGEIKDEKIFELLRNSFEKINDTNLKSEKNDFVYYYFLWNALSLLGYHFEVEKCVGCHKKLNPYNIYFSAKEGGVLCRECLAKDKNSEKINSDIVKILRIILSKDWDIFSKLKIQLATQNLLFKISENAVQTFCPINC